MKRILLVDGESALRDALVDRMDSAYGLVHVTSGADALERLRDRPVDLAILEYRLPDLSGLDLLTRIKGSLPRLPVVMVTAFGSEAICASAFKLGARDYFAKPCDPAELWASLDALLSVAPSQREHRTNVLPAPRPLGSHRPNVPIQRAIRFLQENYGDCISLGDVAQRLGMGKFTLSRRMNYPAASRGVSEKGRTPSE